MQPTLLITGCSSGIGLGAATALKQRGYRVFATARKPADLDKLTALGLESIAMDMNDSQSIQRGLDHVLQATGGTLDALFNNAGFLQAGALEDLNRDLIRTQFETNVFGPVELTRLVLPVMRKQGHGRIIQNSSILGIVTIPFCGAYNASKFALEGFYNTLRQEFRGTRIHVSIINPGPIESNLRQHAHEQYEKTIAHEQSGAYKAVYERMEKTYFKANKVNRALEQGPELVTKKLIHALEHPRPHAHYYVGRVANLMAWMRRLLPDQTLDWFTSKR